MARHDTRLFVVTSGVPCELENLSGEILQYGGQVHGCASTNALSIVALLQETMDTADRKLDCPRKGDASGGIEEEREKAKDPCYKGNDTYDQPWRSASAS